MFAFDFFVRQPRFLALEYIEKHSLVAFVDDKDLPCKSKVKGIFDHSIFDRVLKRHVKQPSILNGSMVEALVSYHRERL